MLIVDDDTTLLKLMTAYLSQLGYEVVSCSSAEDAWRRLESEPSSYALALVDLTMPGMGGEELARKILEANPSIYLIAASGYPADLSHLGAAERVSFLHKPFSPDMLLLAVKQWLGEGPV